VEKLLDTYSFEAPEGLMKSELARLVSETKAMGTKTGTDEEIEKEFQSEAEKNARIACILDIVGEKEGVTVSEDELKQEIYGFAMRYNVSPENIIKYYTSKDGSIESLKNAIFDRKTMKILLEKAKKEKE
jgi:trigger factor